MISHEMLDWNGNDGYIITSDSIVASRFHSFRISMLGEIERYHTLPMIHRTDNLIHSVRTNWITNFIHNVMAKNGYDIECDWDRACMLALVHDDAEIFTGDTPMPKKRNATSRQIRAMEEMEYVAKHRLDNFAYITGGYPDYRKMLDEASEKQTIESQAVNVADKLDALGEMLHEVRSGNDIFLDVLKGYKPVFDEFLDKYKWWQQLSCEEYFKLDKFPTIEQAKSIPLLTEEQCYSKRNIEKTLLQRSPIPWYDAWIYITVFRIERGYSIFDDPYEILMPERSKDIYDI